MFYAHSPPTTHQQIAKTQHPIKNNKIQKSIVFPMKYAILVGNKIDFLLLFIAFYWPLKINKITMLQMCVHVCTCCVYVCMCWYIPVCKRMLCSLEGALRLIDVHVWVIQLSSWELVCFLCGGLPVARLFAGCRFKASCQLCLTLSSLPDSH